MLIRVMTSSLSVNYCTPAVVLEPLRALDDIGLDPCSNPLSIVRAHVEWMLERGEDGLQQPWSGHGLVYVNPPFGRSYFPRWSRKIVEEARLTVEHVVLTPARTGSAWCQRLLSECDAHCFWKGRLRFLSPPPIFDAAGELVPWAERNERLSVEQLAQLERRQPSLVETSAAPFDCVVTYFGHRPKQFRREFAACGLTESHSRRRAACAYELLLETAGGEQRWHRSRLMPYSKAVDKVNELVGQGHQARLAEAA